jgi:hypothetical protein
MLGGRESKLLVLGWGALLGAFTFLAITDFAIFTNAEWCGVADEHCLREWIGALSGWAAAIAAGVTLVALYDQIREQRKQTDFILGDAPPTLDVIQDLDDEEEIVLRLVNWNRRGVILKTIELEDFDANIGVMDFKENGKPKNLKDRSPPYLRGWENRSQGPNSFQFKLSASVDNVLVRDWPRHSTISVTLQIIGDIHRKVQLRGRLFPD